MADTFFGFDTSLKNGDNLLSADDLDCLENEDEYDALNDETFGGLDDASSLDDWEQQHEQFAEIAESSKHSDHLENSLAQFVLDEGYDPLSKDSVWAFTPPNKNGDGDLFNSSILSSLQKASKSFIESHVEPDTLVNRHTTHQQQQQQQQRCLGDISDSGGGSAFAPSPLSFLVSPRHASLSSPGPGLRQAPPHHMATVSTSSASTAGAPSRALGPPPGLPKKICTVEELEKGLLMATAGRKGGKPPPGTIGQAAIGSQLQQQYQQQQQQQGKGGGATAMAATGAASGGGGGGQLQQLQQQQQKFALSGQPLLQGHGPVPQPQPGPPPGLGPHPQGAPPGLGPHPQGAPPHQFHPMFPPHMPPAQRGRPRGMILTRLAYMPPGPHPNLPGFVRMMPPHPLLQGGGGHPAMPNPMYLHNRQMPANGPPFHHQPSQFGFGPAGSPLGAHQRHHHQQQPPQLLQHPMGGPAPPLLLSQQMARQRGRQRDDSLGGDDQHGGGGCRDEYAGLMSPREKQWLLNIQLLQLNTGTPYFDDYYYTVFKERKLKSKENQMNERNAKFPNRQRRNSDRQENTTLTPRVYTPLQFENSLGKLQCGSVTAPRKIIDMDVVQPEKEGGGGGAGDGSGAPGAVSVRDTRKTKQLLLELEALYTLLLHAEDITNPTAQINTEKLREIRQKQRLRELELAPTPEQKQEVLRLFKLESEPVVEDQREYMARIAGGLLQDDRFTGFMVIRKGRLLLLRLLPYLTADTFATQLLEIWSRLLLSLPVVGRRDTAGENILPKFYPLFRRYIQASTMSDILDIASGLIETVKLENSRSTPLSHQGRAPLYFVLQNKFGVSALAAILVQCECLISLDKATEKQQAVWYSFVVTWTETLASVSRQASPIEPLPVELLAKHCTRIAGLTEDRRQLLEKQITAESN